MPSTRMVIAQPSTRAVFDPTDFRDRVESVIQAVKKLETVKGLTINALAGSGHSGLPVIAAAAYKMEKAILAVRKKNDSTHDDNTVNGEFRDGMVYVIVDDFVETGATLAHIKQEIEKEYRIWIGAGEPHCVGAILHSGYGPEDYDKSKLTRAGLKLEENVWDIAAIGKMFRQFRSEQKKVQSLLKTAS